MLTATKAHFLSKLTSQRSMSHLLRPRRQPFHIRLCSSIESASNRKRVNHQRKHHMTMCYTN